MKKMDRYVRRLRTPPPVGLNPAEFTLQREGRTNKWVSGGDSYGDWGSGHVASLDFWPLSVAIPVMAGDVDYVIVKVKGTKSERAYSGRYVAARDAKKNLIQDGYIKKSVFEGARQASFLGTTPR